MKVKQNTILTRYNFEKFKIYDCELVFSDEEILILGLSSKIS